MTKQECFDLALHLDKTIIDIVKETARHLDSLLKLQDISPVPSEVYEKARAQALLESAMLLAKAEETRAKLMRSIDNYTLMERMN